MLKKTALKTIAGLGILLITQNATAEIVEMTCPDISTLQFTKNGPDVYTAQGNVNIIKGNTPPIELYGVTTAKNALSFMGANYIQDRSERIFAIDCLYAGTDVLNQSLIHFDIKNNPVFGLEYCYFPNMPGQQCSGNYSQCALRCEFL